MTMPIINFEPYDNQRQNLKYAVIVARYQDQFVLCRHRNRSTWEVPGGHLEAGETPLQTGQRELYEETGALDYVLLPVSIYTVTGSGGETGSGALFYAEICEFGQLPDFEIVEIKLFTKLPSAMTYADIQPHLIEMVMEHIQKQRKLAELSDDELHALFPVRLVEHDPIWAKWYGVEQRRLQPFILTPCKIHHYGSTAIPHIMAKPIIDVLVEINQDANLDQLTVEFQSAGYFKMTEENGLPMFAKGYTKYGFTQKMFHVHTRYQGDQEELLFRDYLIAHPEDAQLYEQLKQKLKAQFGHNRDMYTEGKAEFIQQILTKAKA